MSAVNLSRSSIGRQMLSSDMLEKEFRFSLLVNAGDYFGEKAEGEDMLLQGIIDCFFIKDGELTILDYKTDKVTPEEAPRRAKSYIPQLRVYGEALKKILGCEPRHKYIYFLSCGQLIEV